MEQENTINEATSPQSGSAPNTAEYADTQKITASSASFDAAASNKVDKETKNSEIDTRIYETVYKEILVNLHAFTPADQVACRITEEHITSYLENSHEERILQYKERREKRFFSTLELIAVLASIVLVVWALQENSAILVTLLYIIAGLGALFIWRSPDKLGLHVKGKTKDTAEDE